MSYIQQTSFAFLLTVGFFVASLGFGSALTYRLREYIHHASGRLLVSATFGIGLFCYLLFVAAAVGLLRPAIFLTLMGMGFLLALRYASWLKLDIAFVGSRAIDIWRGSRFDALLLGIVGLVFVINFFAACTPVVFGDALSYNLPLARLLAEKGQVFYSPAFEFSVFPFLIETVYAAMLQLGAGQHGALFIDFLLNGIFWSGLWLVGSRLLGSRTALLGLGFMLTSTAFFTTAISTKTDYAASTFAIVGLYVILVALEMSAQPLFVLAGMLFGFALATKYSLLFTVAAIFVYLLFHRRGRELDLRKNFRLITLSGLGFLLAVAPELAKGAILVGNPVAPVLGKYFGGDQIYPYFSNWKDSFPARVSWLQLVLLPLSMTFLSAAGGVGGLSPFYLGFAPFFRLVRQKREAKFLLGMALLMLIVAIIGQGLAFQTRYILVPVALFGLVAAAIADAFAASVSRKLIVLLLLLSTVTFIYKYDSMARHYHYSFNLLSGRLSEAEFYLGFPSLNYRVYTWLNENVKDAAHERVVLWRNEYVLRSDIILNRLKASERYQLYNLSYEDRLERLRQLHIRYVVEYDGAEPLLNYPETKLANIRLALAPGGDQTYILDIGTN